MTDPKRLIDDADLGASLLVSALDDAPSRAARERTAAALGLSSAIVGGASTAGSGASAAGASGTGGAPIGVGSAKTAGAAGTTVTGAAGTISGTASGGALAASGWPKAIAGLVLGVAIGGGSVAALNGSSATPSEPASTRPSGTSASRTASAASTAKAPQVENLPPPTHAAVSTDDETASKRGPDAEDRPLELAASRQPLRNLRAEGAPLPASRVAEPAPTSDVMQRTPTTSALAPATAPGLEDETALAREVRSLDGARSALARGDAEGALRSLDEHDRRFTSGYLRTEAGVLRVEALLAHGDRGPARALARDLLRREPSGPQAHRLKAIVSTWDASE